jgi:hypothetical protein
MAVQVGTFGNTALMAKNSPLAGKSLQEEDWLN